MVQFQTKIKKKKKKREGLIRICNASLQISGSLAQSPAALNGLASGPRRNSGLISSRRRQNYVLYVPRAFVLSTPTHT